MSQQAWRRVPDGEGELGVVMDASLVIAGPPMPECFKARRQRLDGRALARRQPLPAYEFIIEQAPEGPTAGRRAPKAAKVRGMLCANHLQCRE
jgi:hypothetical protein